MIVEIRIKHIQIRLRRPPPFLSILFATCPPFNLHLFSSVFHLSLPSCLKFPFVLPLFSTCPFLPASTFHLLFLCFPLVPSFLPKPSTCSSSVFHLSLPSCLNLPLVLPLISTCPFLPASTFHC